jgi:uncharacterized protein YndB with AHSA1/START domain
MIQLDTDAVEREIRIAASPETIYSFFTDPERMVRWKGTEATLDPRPGGVYRVNVTGRNVVSGRYVELVPYRKVVFTWGWEGEGSLVPPGSSTVEIALIPDGAETIVRLTHRDLPSTDRGSHAEGWEHFLPRLAVAAPGGDPGPDPWVAAG